MAKVNFYLDKPTSKTETQIYLFFSYSGKRLRIYTGQKVKPKNWDKRKQRAKGIGNVFHVELNLLLDDLENTIKASYVKFIRAGDEITKNNLLKELREILDKEKDVEPTFNLITYMDHLYEKMKKENKSKDSIKGFKSKAKLIANFAKKRNHNFEDIDLKFVLDFRDLLINKKFSNNYANKLIGTFKTVMNRAIDERLTTNRDWVSSRFFISKEKVHNIYFNIDQLIYLFNFKFKDEHISRTRDWFLIYCFTGLRSGDGVELHQDKLIEENGRYYFTVNTKKTNERVSIPLHPIVKMIMDKYNGGLPLSVSQQTTNKNLKVMGKKAGFNDPVYKTITKGGKRIEKKYYMWQLITTHTGRRSLATNLHLANVPSKSAMLITGHKTVKQYMEYIKITSEQNARILSQSKFYNIKLKRV